MKQIAPYMESYIPAPEFKYSPSVKEIDFAQLIGSGCDPVQALIESGIINKDQQGQFNHSQLYARAGRLIASEAVAERIKYYRLLHQQGMDVKLDHLLQEAAAIAHADFAGAFYNETIYDEEGREIAVPGMAITNPHDMPRHIRAAIKEFYIDKEGVVRIKWHDKMTAMKFIAELQGYYDEFYKNQKVQVNINLGSGPDSIKSLSDNETVIEVDSSKSGSDPDLFS